MGGRKKQQAAQAINILVEAPQWNDIPEVEAEIRKAAACALAAAEQSGSEINILLGDDASIRALNSQFRHIDKPTNVLSFPAAEGPGKGNALGDIVLGYETVAREAKEQNKAFLHHAQHLTMHGVLHLLGFDHESEDEAAEMEALETRLCLSLGIADPYKDPDTGN
ncbi:MAG: rRNA maturation RNase YbeY [Alphaproteobacteria bacterium]